MKNFIEMWVGSKPSFHDSMASHFLLKKLFLAKFSKPCMLLLSLDFETFQLCSSQCISSLTFETLGERKYIFLTISCHYFDKMNKTSQFNNQARLLKIPLLNNQICPFRALRECVNFVPGGNNSSLFQFKFEI